MGYHKWFIKHAEKHKEIIDKLVQNNYTQEQILDYFDFENMVKNEPDFCPLYKDNKKCHDMESLNCYLCACPNFRFNDKGITQVGAKTQYSICNIDSKDGRQGVYGDKIHQDCSNCTLPHHKSYAREKFDLDWKNIMSVCGVNEQTTYEHKHLDIQTYIDSLYLDGFKKSLSLDDAQLEKSINDIGLFKFKGYIKAFRENTSHYSIDDILYLYHFDRDLSINMFKMVSTLEIKIKTYLIEAFYELTDNPFCYLIKDNYKKDFILPSDSLVGWEVKETKIRNEISTDYRDYYLLKYDYEDNFSEYLNDKELIKLDKSKNIDYPPFHYLIENATLGTVIELLLNLKIKENDILKIIARKFGILKPDVFISYLLRIKEIRNRAAHNGQIFNRNYRSVKAIGKFKEIRKDIYEHRLLDVYYTLYFLLGEASVFKNSDDLENRFIQDNFKKENKKMEKFVMNCLRKR